MDFTAEEHKALEEQKRIRDEADRTLKRAKLAIENIEENGRLRGIVRALKTCIPGFLPPFKVESTRILFYVSECWWIFPHYARYFKVMDVYRIYVSREERRKRFCLSFSQFGYKNCDNIFHPSLELIALGTLLINEFYSKQEFVFDEYAIWKIKNPLLL